MLVQLWPTSHTLYIPSLATVKSESIKTYATIQAERKKHYFLLDTQRQAATNDCNLLAVTYIRPRRPVLRWGPQTYRILQFFQGPLGLEAILLREGGIPDSSHEIYK
jgi:hypothetical protein